MAKRFNIADYGYVIGIFALSVAITTFSYSCKTQSLAVDRYIPRPYVVHDTVRVSQKPMSEADRAAMVSKFFKNGYEQNIQPQFDRLYGVIAKQQSAISLQAVSIHTLSETLISMRTRAIHNRDSMQRIINDERLEGLRLQREHNVWIKNQVQGNQQQIVQLKGIANFLLWGFASLWGAFLIFAGAVYIWYKKLKRDIKRANYA